MVFQEVYLFEGTILENIRFGRPDATDDEVIAAAKAAQCDVFIRALPDGYHTRTGDRGIRFSGGERQRISIARAILKNAPVLIMDEATAFVDPENELLMQDAFTRLCSGRTVLVIAHRLNTIREVDQILFLEDGMIRESGTFTDLMGKQGMFAGMYNRFEKTLAWKIGDDC